MQFRAIILLVVLAICVQCLPVEPKFRQMSLQAQESQTSADIQSISARITFLQKLNKLTYDTTLFTRKLRWLLRRSLTEKPTVGEVAALMAKELEISKAQIDVAAEGVADELKLEVKQGIIALKAGLAFIQDNYKAGSDPQADAIIAKIKANLASLEARFGKKTGMSVGTGGIAAATGGVTPEASTGGIAPPVEQSTTIVPPVEQSTTIVPPVVEQSTTLPPPAAVESSTASPSVPAGVASTGGSLIGGSPVAESTAEAAPVGQASTPAAPSVGAASTPAPVSSPATTTGGAAPVATPTVLGSSTGLFNSTNGTASTGEEGTAESSLSATAPASASTFF